ncbi:hypothetical protein CLV58_13129 [Spirosoma oryzae]|uniref:DUF3408 domain-containing protein n=1 Tax=Spirosoma oryzae TaxID=1469603 RepID=A0A2T0S315_9BACT|nr:hypothetical protein [Spirosoma oryzae]PRY27811.1 hypothetical protein CLV58_13129 [Spirosoma oryzae]
MAKSNTGANPNDIGGMLGAMNQSTSMSDFIKEIKSDSPEKKTEEQSKPVSENAPTPSPPPGQQNATPVHCSSPQKIGISLSVKQSETDDEQEPDLTHSTGVKDRTGVDTSLSLVSQTADEFCTMNLQMKSMANGGLKHINISPRLHNILSMLAEYTENIGAPVPMQTILDNVLSRYFKANEKALRTINRRNLKSKEDRFDL